MGIEGAVCSSGVGGGSAGGGGGGGGGTRGASPCPGGGGGRLDMRGSVYISPTVVAKTYFSSSAARNA
jgi:hypothetical protein